MKTFKDFIIEAEDSKRKSWDNLPGEYQSKPQVVSPLDRLKSAVKQLIPKQKSYIRQDLERRQPSPSKMPGSPPVGSDPTDVKVKTKMPMPSGRYTKPTYYDV